MCDVSAAGAVQEPACFFASYVVLSFVFCHLIATTDNYVIICILSAPPIIVHNNIVREKRAVDISFERSMLLSVFTFAWSGRNVLGDISLERFMFRRF